MSKIINGDAIIEMKKFPDNFFDSIITDPPAGISFMGKSWDSDKGGRDAWIKWLAEVFIEAKRVLKPGGHALVWSLPRTSHWTGMALEDAGFECRDKIFDLLSSNNIYNDFMYSLNPEQQKMWGLLLEGLSPSSIEHIFGSGFPKSLSIDKAIDKMKGAEREIVGGYLHGGTRKGGILGDNIGQVWHDETAPATPEAKQWSGYGTALKPAVENWWLVRKPISENTIAENVLKWGVGGLNINDCRVPSGIEHMRGNVEAKITESEWKNNSEFGKPFIATDSPLGRFPANLIHDGSDEVLAEFAKAGITTSGKVANEKQSYDGESITGFIRGKTTFANQHGDSGTPARFFYCAKPSRSERNIGLEGMNGMIPERYGKFNGTPDHAANRQNLQKNNHPTVKAQALMEYLIKLITPPNGHILDMFGGSGSTGVAANSLGFESTLIEIDPEYCKIANLRTKNMEYKEITPKGKIGTFDDKDIEEFKKEYGKKKRKSLFE